MTSCSETNKKRIFAADMWAVLNFGQPNDRYQRFLANGRPRFSRLVDSLLLYDEVIVPTQDFLSLTVLVGVLGDRAVMELLEAGTLRFLRLVGSLSYVGNGGGIQDLEQSASDPLSFCRPVDQMVEWALRGLENYSNIDSRLPDLVCGAATEVHVRAVKEDVRHETYMDILKSPSLRARFALRGNLDINRLGGLDPNEVRIYGGLDEEWKNDEIGVVLALAATNLELRLAQHAGCMDSSTVSPVGLLLKAKAERSAKARAESRDFAVLREVAGIPDLGEAVLQGKIAVGYLLKLSRSRSGEEFRRWFHEHCREDPLAAAREYAKLLRGESQIKSLPVRVLRYIVTTALGLIPGVGIVAGPAAAALDSFFLERWVRDSSPKFFIERLSQMK